MTPDHLKRLRAVAEAAFDRDRLALGETRNARGALSAQRDALSENATAEISAAGLSPDMASVLSRYLAGVERRTADLVAEDAALASEEARRLVVAANSFRKAEAVRFLEVRAATARRRRRAAKEEAEIAAIHGLRRASRGRTPNA